MKRKSELRKYVELHLTCIMLNLRKLIMKSLY